MASDQVREDPVKTTVIVLLTTVFVGLYVAAMFGWTSWKPDGAAIPLLQPVVYVIIGYYFGRIPAEATERTLRKEVETNAEKATNADAKVKAVRAVLATPASGPSVGPTAPLTGPGASLPRPQSDSRVDAALRILDAPSP